MVDKDAVAAKLLKDDNGRSDVVGERPLKEFPIAIGGRDIALFGNVTPGVIEGVKV